MRRRRDRARPRVARVRHPRRPRANAEGAAARARRTRAGRRPCRRCATSRCASSPARPSGSSGATAPARPRRCARSRGSCRSTAGSAECGGRVVTLLELGAGFGRDFSGRENILLNGALHGMTRPRSRTRIDAIVEFTELGEFIDVPVQDVLERDVRPARVRHRRPPRRRRDADRRGPRGRRRGVPAQVRAADRRAGRGRRDARARLARRGARSSARASAWSCSTGARSPSTARPARGWPTTTG